MTDTRDPLRLMDAQHVDPALRAALRQVSRAQPDAAEVAALVERVGDALGGSASGASWLSQFVSHGGGFKWLALLVAGGATVWGATKTWPQIARPELVVVAPHEVERATEQQSPDSAGSPPIADRASAARNTVAAEPLALPMVDALRSEAPSVVARREAPAPTVVRRGQGHAASSATRGAPIRPAPATRARSASRAASPSPPPKEAETAQHDVPTGEESELALITRAQSALKLAPRRALELLDRHDTLYPTGHFAEEREVLWIDALSQLGMRRALAARGQRFLASYPSSLHCARVRRLLEATRPPR